MILKYFPKFKSKINDNSILNIDSTKFLMFICAHILFSLLIITIFKQVFELKLKIVVAHLILIFTLHFVVLLLGVLVISFNWLKKLNLNRYIAALIYGIFTVFLYIVYLLSFLGMYFNSQIFNFDIFFAYLSNLNGFIESISGSYFLIYFVVFGIPLLFFAFYLYINKFIYKGLKQFKIIISKHNLNSSNLYIQFNVLVFLVGIGFLVCFISIRQFDILKNFSQIDEPIITTFFTAPLQGQYIVNYNADFEIRKNYPKNLKFDKKNVIVIVVDALRADHLGLFGYNRPTSPFLDSLYNCGKLAKMNHSFSVAGASFPGINGILRSKIWADMSYENFSLQHLLKDQGYKLNFILSGDHTHFYGLKSFYGKNSDFNLYFDGSMTDTFFTNNDNLIFEGLNKIGNYNNEPNYFHFHFNSVHSAGYRLNDFNKYLPANPTARDTINYTNRYDNGILQVDYFIKKLFQTLENKGYLQNSIVVITADHGESLGEMGDFGHTRNVYTDHILVPILIYNSDNIKFPERNYALTLDIAPTIIDMLGLPIPESWDGISLLRDTRHEYSYHEMSNFYAVIKYQDSTTYKYVFNSKNQKEEIYELNKDLYESTNIINSLSNDERQIFRKQLLKFHITPFRK